MTTNLIFANVNDAYLFSSNAAYATALAGSSLGQSSASDTSLTVGQQKSGTPYTVWQSFMEFAVTTLSGRSVVSGFLRMVSSSVTGTSVTRALEINHFDYGTLTTADWRTPAQLQTLYASDRLGGIGNIQNASNLTVRAGILDLTDYDAVATKRVVMNSSRNRLQTTPTGLEYNSFRSADYGGSANIPAIYLATNTDSLLSRCLGAQIQLSDGSHVYANMSSATLGSDQFTVSQRTVAGSTTLIDTVVDIANIRRGAQSIAMCRDSNDNFYILSQSGTSNTLHVRAYIKNQSLPNTWAILFVRSIPLPIHDQDINNIAVAWHRRGGSGGTLVAVVSHQAGSNTGTETAYLMINCDYLLSTLSTPPASAGPILRASGSAIGTLIAASSVDGFYNFTNETGTLLDMSPARFVGDDTGFLMSTARHHVLGTLAGQSLCRYTINPAGNGFAEVWNIVDTSSGFAVKDGNAKSRVLPINNSLTQYVTVTASYSDGYGITIKHRQQQADQFTVLAEVRLAAQAILTLPTPVNLSVANNWDAIYNPLDNKVWVYYFDATGDGRRLLRTDIDLNTGQAGLQQIEVNATIGATGSSNLAIRVHRGHTIGEQVLVTVANRTDGGVHSIILVPDTINIAPSQPLLTTRTNFDATTSAQFAWTFKDLNSVDSQSAFRLTIDNATTGATGWDTGKVVSGTSNYTLPASSLPNGQNWKWRVMTWDSHDASSPWSDYGFFTTSDTGVVNITDPAVDNDPSIVTANYLMLWSVANTTQTAYNITITRTDTGATLVATGWVSSSVTQYLIQGMASDVQWNVALKIRNASLIESNTANRLITPSYNRPEVPILAFDIEDDLGYIQLNITNPDPVGDRPNPTENQVQRRVYNPANPTTSWQIIGSTDPNSTFKDFTAASGVLYEYRIRAIAGEFFQDSTPTLADRELNLQGVWLHDPSDSEVTIRQFLYGKDTRSHAIDTTATIQQFAGRTFPVTDFGEHETEETTVTVDIPHGPDHYTEEGDLRGFMELKRTLFYRDNRGRAVYGTMTGFNQADQAWGVTVGFKFDRVSFDIEEI